MYHVGLQSIRRIGIRCAMYREYGDFIVNVGNNPKEKYNEQYSEVCTSLERSYIWMFMFVPDSVSKYNYRISICHIGNQCLVLDLDTSYRTLTDVSCRDSIWDIRARRPDKDKQRPRIIPRWSVKNIPSHPFSGGVNFYGVEREVPVQCKTCENKTFVSTLLLVN